MSDTTHLLLPLMAAAQAQKHVTHNEALLRLDALVQLAVVDRDLTEPPADPSDGDRYIPATGATGAWADWDWNVAWLVDGVWTKLVPRPGWRAWVEDEAVLLVWDGAAWIEIDGGVGARKVDILAPHEELVVKRATAATVEVDAEAVVLFDAGGQARRFAGLDVTLDLTASGAGGLDTGSEASSTEYHIWAIGKTDGTLAALFSTSGSAPALPSGYTYRGYLGSVYNDAEGDLLRYSQRGRAFTMQGVRVLQTGTQTSYTAISLAAGFPSRATKAHLQGIAFSTSGTNSVFIILAPHGSGTTATYGGATWLAHSVDTNGFRVPVWVTLLEAQQVYYRVSGTNAALTLDLIGGEY